MWAIKLTCILCENAITLAWAMNAGVRMGVVNVADIQRLVRVFVSPLLLAICSSLALELSMIAFTVATRRRHTQ